jgi:CHASE3 domain sensor protein
MNNEKSSKIKLIHSFIALGMFVLVSIIVWSYVTKLNDYEKIRRNNLTALSGLYTMRESVASEMNACRTFLLTEIDDEIAKRLLTSIKKSREHAEIGAIMYRELPKTSKEKEIYENFNVAWNRYWEGMEKAEKLSQEYYKTKNRETYEMAFKFLLTDMDNIRDYYDIRDMLKEMIAINRETAENNINNSSKLSNILITVSIVSIIMTILIILGSVIKTTLNNIIMKRVNKIIEEKNSEFNK